MPEYEVKYLDKDYWEDIKERVVLETLEKSFIQKTKILNEMLCGKMILTSNAFYRIKKQDLPAEQSQYATSCCNCD